MMNPKDYEETDLRTYQRLIKKLMYFLCNTRPDIAFVIEQLNRHNTNLKKDRS